MLRFIKFSFLLFTILYGSHVYGSGAEELIEESKVSPIPIISVKPIVFPESGLTYHPETKTFTGTFFDEANHAIAQVSRYYLGKMNGEKGYQSKLLKGQQKLETLKASFDVRQYHILKEKTLRVETLTDKEIVVYNDLYKQEGELIYAEKKVKLYQSIVDKCQQRFNLLSEMYTLLSQTFYLEMLASKVNSTSTFPFSVPLTQIQGSIDSTLPLENFHGFNYISLNFPELERTTYVDDIPTVRYLQEIFSPDDIKDIDLRKWKSSSEKFISFLQLYYSKSYYTQQDDFDEIKGYKSLKRSKWNIGPDREISRLQEQMALLAREDTIEKLRDKQWRLEHKIQPLVNLFKAFIEILGKFQQDLKTQAQAQAQSSNQ